MAKTTQGRNDSGQNDLGRNDPGPKDSGPKRLWAETTRYPRVDNNLGGSMASMINLLECVCHVSLNFIDPFDNPIIKLRYVLCLIYYELNCLTPVAMRRGSIY